MMIDYQKEAEVLKALANPIRLRILDVIRDGEVCVKTLEEITGASQSCVSQHLAILRKAGIVKGFRDGNLVCYSLDHQLADEILHCIHEQYPYATTHQER